MPRQARIKSSTGIYHIMMRGINRQNIFHDNDDYGRFLDTLFRFKTKCGYKIYAYCLMKNHIHLLLHVEQEPLEKTMRRICASYVRWYNTKYQRVGYLFQDRFKSEVVEDESYFLTVFRYIHQNPLKAGYVNKIDEYPWSSWHEYHKTPRIVCKSYVLNIFNDDNAKAFDSLHKFCMIQSDDQCLDFEEGNQINDREAKNIILRVFQIKHIFELQNLEKSHRNKCLKELRDNYNFSIRQLERLTGINRGIIQRVK